MRKFLLAMLAAAAVGAAMPGEVRADWRPRPVPVPGGSWPLPPVYHPGWPGWPGYPGPVYPRPRPRPPEVQIRYTVHYRPAPFASWRVYGSYSSHARAAAAARRLEAFGYQTDIVVTY